MGVFESTNDPHPDEIPAFKYPDQSNYGKEMRRWNRKKREGGMNADGFEKFPMMLHKAHQIPGTRKWATALPEPIVDHFENDNQWNRAVMSAARFTTSCQRIVANAQEYERARDEGWRDNPLDAMAWRDALETEVSNEAAARAARDSKMSPAAQAEAAAADAETPDHLAEIPTRRYQKRARAAGAA